MELIPFVSQAETKQGIKRSRDGDEVPNDEYYDPDRFAKPIYGNPYWKPKYHKKKGNHKKMARKYRKSSRRRSSVTYYDRVAKAVQFRPPYIRKVQGIDDPATPEAWAATQFGMSERLATPAQIFARAQHGYRGRGAYSLGKMWRKSGLGKTLAGVGRGVINAAGARAIGAISGAGLYSGRGAYTDNMEVGNEVMDGSHMQSAQIESAGDETGAICITNEEYVGDIYAPASTGIFDNTPFPLNPGLEQTFPWLSQLAANYEEYEFKQLVFKFKSAIQDVNSANGQVGTIITATNYNASQKLFPDKPSMSAYYGSVSSKTTDDQVSGVECDPHKLSGPAGHYVRTNPVLIGEDLKSYDHGIFQLATHNIPSSMLNGTLGELRVYYTVVLRKPKFLTARGLAITRALFVSNGGETPALPLGPLNNILSGQQNNLRVLVAVATNTITLTFPSYYAGNLEIKLAVEGTGNTGSLINTLVGAGQVSKVFDLYGGGLGGDSPTDYVSAQGATSLVAVMHLRVQPATNATLNTYTITTAIVGMAITQTSLDIAEYNSSFNNASGAPDLINSAGVVVVPA